MNPKSYCIEKNIKTVDFIAKVKDIAPKYSKSTHCMASDPAYGVVLAPAVAAYARGKKENRRLPCRLYLRCAESMLPRLNRAKELLGFETNQQVLAFALQWFLREIEKAAPDAATSRTAKGDNLTSTIPETGGVVNG